MSLYLFVSDLECARNPGSEGVGSTTDLVRDGGNGRLI